MVIPLPGQCLVVEPPDQTKAGRPGKHGDVLPLLIPLQDLPGSRRELLIDAAGLLDGPHTTLCLYHIRYVKAGPSFGITLIMDKLVDLSVDNLVDGLRLAID